LRREVVLALPHFQAVALAVAASDCIAAIPFQIAAHVRDGLRLRLFKPAVPTPAPGVFLYWHSRYDDDPVHAWLRTMVRERGAECGFSDFDRAYLEA
jgi:DNA-binding transcriptional LysR family regulator